jgi:hypothetical protein
MSRPTPDNPNLRLHAAPAAGGKSGPGAHPVPDRLRIEQLLIDRATTGLDAAGEADLKLLLQRTGTAFDESYELAAAAADVALRGPAPKGELPAELRQRILAAGEQWLARRAAGESDAVEYQSLPMDIAEPLARITPRLAEQRSAGSLARQYGGWLAAAACLGLAVLVSLQRQSTPPLTPTVTANGGATFSNAARNIEDQVRSLLSDASTVVVSLLSDDQAGDKPADLVGPPTPAAQVIWSGEHQQGFVRVSGLRPIEQPGDQYQLWVFDTLRGGTTPVPLGVFDVQQAGAVTLVPITTPLKIGHAATFAITVERAGGSLQPSPNSLVVIGGQRPPAPSPAGETAEPTPTPANTPANTPAEPPAPNRPAQ